MYVILHFYHFNYDRSFCACSHDSFQSHYNDRSHSIPLFDILLWHRWRRTELVPVICRQSYAVHPQQQINTDGFHSSADAPHLQLRMSVCINEVMVWMCSHRLQLNTAKTEVFWCTSSQLQHQIPRHHLRSPTT